jgi:hypothetical protein
MIFITERIPLLREHRHTPNDIGQLMTWRDLRCFEDDARWRTPRFGTIGALWNAPDPCGIVSQMTLLFLR